MAGAFIASTAGRVHMKNALIGGARISMISPNQRIRNPKSSAKDHVAREWRFRKSRINGCFYAENEPTPSSPSARRSFAARGHHCFLGRLRKESQVEGGTPPEVDPMKMGRLLNPALTLWLVCIASMLATASVEGKPTAIKVRPLSRATRGPFISSTNYYSSRRDDDARRPR